MSEGNVSYSVKEILGDIKRHVTAIDEKLDQKADRSDVHDLKTRVTALELTTVKREGPIIQELRHVEETVGDLRGEVRRLENGVGNKILTAIQSNNDRLTSQHDRTFSRTEKLVGLGLLITPIVLRLLGVEGVSP